jgi:ABC-type antimicrobial peptide transport system permease subunit
MAYSHVYVKLAGNTKDANVESQMNRLLATYNPDVDKDAANYIHLHLERLDDVHFNSVYASFDSRIAHKPTLYRLLAVASFLLLLACINFINLTTANAASRAKEIGIRKTMAVQKRNSSFNSSAKHFC